MNLPRSFIQSLQDVPGFNEEAFIAVHQLAAQITSVRLNPEKFKIQNSKFKTEESVPWSSNGYYLPERPSFTLDPLFHAGAYYVQEASSMFLEQALKQTVNVGQPLKVLDLCAAPGGKSTLIQAVISKESLLVSNEVIKTRVNILTENITKWGAANVIVTNNDPADFKKLPGYFDVIVVDAPCSGSGLFRKQPDAVDEWSENNVLLCVQRQQRIVADVMPSLKAGGVFIYSTCSYSKEEDEQIEDWLVNQFKVETVRLKVEENWGIVETVSEKEKAYGYRFYPDKVKGEGFFIAAFKKPGSDEKEKNQPSATFKSKFKTRQTYTASEINTIKPYLAEAQNYFFVKQHEEVIAIPLHLQNDLAIIQSALYIKKAGVRLGTIIRNELIPAHDLAISTLLHPSVPRLETDAATALQYLRKADVSITGDAKGWVLLTHQQLCLGWVKIMANRTNNYYPKEWRILNK